ncbi:MAG: metallophosphoesterase [Dehalococcoidales bacterium]|nr:metallophosphoesterase [Dehalococcoidales bacterium]
MKLLYPEHLVIPQEFVSMYWKSRHTDKIINQQEAAEKFNCTDRTIRNWIQYLRDNTIIYRDGLGILHVYGDVVHICDVHAPLHKEKFIDDVCKVDRIKSLIINGDLFNQESFSFFLKKQKDADFEEELGTVETILKRFLEVYDTISIVPGNHDERLSKNTEWVITFEHILAMIGLKDLINKRIFLTSADHLFYNDTFRCVHPHKYRAKPCSLAVALAKRFKENIICAHTHMLGKEKVFLYEKNTDFQGREYENVKAEYTVFDAGGGFDKDKIRYKIENTTTHSEWRNGFIVFRDGKNEIITDEKLLSYTVRVEEKIIW